MGRWQRKRRRSLTKVVALGAAMMLILAACGDDDDSESTSSDTTSPPAASEEVSAAWKAIEEKAAQEGEVVVYTSIPGSDTFFPKAFAEDYPNIRVTVVRANSADLVARMEQERQAKSAGADVAMHTNGFWFQTVDTAGDVAAFSPEMPALEKWPKEYLKGKHATAATLTPQGFAFNTSQQKPFKTWDGFLDPALKGKIAVCDPVPGQTAQLASYTLLDEEFGPEYVDKLGQQQPDLHASTTTIAQGLAAGEYAATTCMLYGSIKPLQDQGAPVEFVVPTDIALGLAFPMAVTGWAQHPNAAQVFANWLLSEKGQTKLIELQGVAASPLPDIPNAIPEDAVTPYDAADYQGTVATQKSQNFTKRLRP